MASKRRFYGKDRNKLKYNKKGRPLCRYCETEVKPPKRTFCSDKCVHEWKLRKSSSYVRYCLFKRDHGVCSLCGVDTDKLKKQGKQILKNSGREAYWNFSKGVNMPPHRKSWWDADHIVPVCEGGGECDLSNYRTLCPPCHKKVTKELQQRLTYKRQLTKNRKQKPPIALPRSSLFG